MIAQFIDYIVRMDFYLNQGIEFMGPWIYVVLFLIVFCETGLVVTPFLPGDSLLFALGALTVVDNAYLSFPILAVTLFVAALCGDLVNYSAGRYFGQRFVEGSNLRFLNRNHLLKAQGFYEKHGKKTIVIARFVPIIRTFAPFVAGLGRMHFRTYISYCIGGAVLWIGIFLTAGHFFGNIPQVKTNFHIVIFAIIFVSLLPAVFEFIKARRERVTTP